VGEKNVAGFFEFLLWVVDCGKDVKRCFCDVVIPEVNVCRLLGDA
jgi:hypothetical protein